MGKVRSKGKKQKNTETLAESFLHFTNSAFQVLISIYMGLMFIIMPLYFTNSYSHIGSDKFDFFKKWSLKMNTLFLPVLILHFVLLAMIHYQGKRKDEKVSVWKEVKEFFQKLSVTDCFVCFYSLILILSYLFCHYKENSLWGSTGWYIGFLTQLILLVAYFAVSRLWKPREWIVYCGLAVSFVVAAIGFLNCFGIDPLKMGIHMGYISTVGNINWFCGYLVCFLFLGFGLFYFGYAGKWWMNIPLILYLLAAFAALLVQASTSGYLALAGVFGMAFVFSGKNAGRMIRLWISITVLWLAGVISYLVQSRTEKSVRLGDFIVRLFFTTDFFIKMLKISLVILIVFVFLWVLKIYPGKVFSLLGKMMLALGIVIVFIAIGLIIYKTKCPEELPFLPQDLFVFSDQWGSNRGATWSAAYLSYRDQNLWHKLIGVGPDNMVMAVYDSKAAAEVAKRNFGEALLTNAHCEWFTVLINTGVLGCIGFAGMMISAIIRFIKAGNKQKLSAACGIALLAYTFNNIFSFQQILNLTMMFLFLGIGEAFLRETKQG